MPKINLTTIIIVKHLLFTASLIHQRNRQINQQQKAVYKVHYRWKICFLHSRRFLIIKLSKRVNFLHLVTLIS